MEDLEWFAELTITPTKAGTKKVLGAGESLNTTVSVDASKPGAIEEACHFRWPDADHEFEVVKRLLDKPELSWNEYYQLMEETQNVWITSKPRQLLFAMHPSAAAAQQGAKRQNTTKVHFSVTSVCVNEFYAFVVRKLREDSPPLLAVASVDGVNEVVWHNTEIEIAKFRVASAFFELLFIVDDYALKIISVLEGVLLDTIDLEPLIQQHLPSDKAPLVNAIRASTYLVLVSVMRSGLLVFARTPEMPLLQAIPCDISTADCSRFEMIAIAMQNGDVEYWTQNEQGEFVWKETELFFSDDVTAAHRKPITMKREAAWNVRVVGPRVAVSSRNYFVMADRTPTSARICKLDSGTIDYFTVFGDFVAVSEHSGSVLMSEYASGTVFYRSDEPKKWCKTAASMGSQHLSYAYDKIIDLLPNGDILVITTRPKEVARAPPKIRSGFEKPTVILQ
jgi:hypothetical protein